MANERIVVLRSWCECRCKACADLNPLDRRNADHSSGDLSIELIEHRLAQSWRHIVGAHLDNPSQRVQVAPRRIDAGDHLLSHSGIRAAHDIALDLGFIEYL